MFVLYTNRNDILLDCMVKYSRKTECNIIVKYDRIQYGERMRIKMRLKVYSKFRDEYTLYSIVITIPESRLKAFSWIIIRSDCHNHKMKSTYVVHNASLLRYVYKGGCEQVY